MTNRDKRIRIEAPSTTQGTNGELTPGWTLVDVVWASIKDLSGREYVTAAATQNPVTSKIETAYRSDITAACRICCGVDVYTIDAVLRSGAADLLLMCRRLS